MSTFRTVLRLASCFLLVLAAACGEDNATGAECPTANAPTYAGFADAFFTSYCRPCHSSSATNRHGAPGNKNYDTEAQIIAGAAEIDAWAAAGPNGTNTAMPELGTAVMTAPSQAERELLGQYLACQQSP